VCEKGTQLAAWVTPPFVPRGPWFGVFRDYIVWGAEGLAAARSAEKREGVPAKLAAALAAVSLTMGTPAFAEQTARLPPLDNGTHDESLSERACGAHPHTHSHTQFGGYILPIFHGVQEGVATKQRLLGRSGFGAETGSDWVWVCGTHRPQPLRAWLRR